MKKDRICNNPALKSLRKALRNNPTPAESALWEQLRAGRLNGSRWRRQYSIGNYILDFYCPGAKLCVELDGSSHYTYQGAKEDAVRTAFLNTKGIKVIRFENRLIWDNLQGVLDIILQELDCNSTENREY